MNEFFELGSPYCLLCVGECDPETHERYNAAVERDNARQREMLAEIKQEMAKESGQG